MRQNRWRQGLRFHHLLSWHRSAVITIKCQCWKRWEREDPSVPQLASSCQRIGTCLMCRGIVRQWDPRTVWSNWWALRNTVSSDLECKRTAESLQRKRACWPAVTDCCGFGLSGDGSTVGHPYFCSNTNQHAVHGINHAGDTHASVPREVWEIAMVQQTVLILWYPVADLLASIDLRGTAF
jgi:hypothetical protein